MNLESGKFMKTILGIIGSPRKGGNTEVLVSAILEAARETGATTSIVSLCDMTIQECDGCHACWKGQHACRKNDDMIYLYRRIAESDSLVFGTPVYWYGPTALMKCFIDRFVYFNCPANRPKIKGKSGAVVVPFEDKETETSDLVIAFFEKSLAYLEMKLIGTIAAPGVTKRGEVGDRREIMERCNILGRKLVKDDLIPCLIS
jgi:multimeric flavodoxin WrbA